MMLYDPDRALQNPATPQHSPDPAVLHVHAVWAGVLRLFGKQNAVIHKHRGTQGLFRRPDDELTVVWDEFATERFAKAEGHSIRELPTGNACALDRSPSVNIGNQRFPIHSAQVHLPGSGYVVGLRMATSDVPTFAQVFVRYEYESPHLPAVARNIIDLGANVGLATVFFGLKYPMSTIVAVEPDDGNYVQLESNVAALGPRVRLKKAAVWTRDGQVNLHSHDAEGAFLGHWGLQVSDSVGTRTKDIPCYTVATLLEDADFAEIDILKIDIEGAEREVFSEAAGDWLARTKLLMIETHDRFRPGSEQAVRAAVSDLFDELPSVGENLIFRRKTDR